MIPVKCPRCQKSYKPVQDEFAGRKVTCQACKTLFVIAGPAVPAAAKPAAQTLAPAPRPAATQPPPAKPVAKSAAAPAPIAAPKPAMPQTPAARQPAGKPQAAPASAPRPAAAQVPAKPPAAKPAPVVAKPAAVNPADVEALAANALSDAPPVNQTAPAAAPTTIDFRCPQCDTDVKVPLNLAGKNAPCPECRRIVRVPLPTQKQPTDWRKVNTGGPSMAKRQADQELENSVWSSSTAEKVTGGELIRAGVIEEKREPWGRGKKIRVVLVGLVVAGLLYGGFLGGRHWWVHNQEEKALRKALDAVAGQGTPLAPLAAAEIYRAAGEYYARAGNQVEQAREQFHKARAQLENDKLKGLPERDALLIDVATAEAGLISTPGQIQKAKHRGLAEKQQDQIMDDLKNTVERIRAPEGRLEALRQITRVLLAKKQEPRAPELAAPVVFGDNQPEALAVIGLERHRAGQSGEAGVLADLALTAITAKEKKGTEKKDQEEKKDNEEAKPNAIIAPSLTALCLLTRKSEAKLALLKAPLGNDAAQLAAYMGHAEALARQKKFDGARAYTQNLPHLDQWRVLTVIAEVGLAQEPPVTTDAEQAAKWDAATLAQLAELERKLTKGPAKPDPSWLLLRLVQQAARRPDADDLAKKLADAIPDPSLRARARLDILHNRLQRSSSPAPDEWANEADAQSSFYPLAREALARHNARYAGSGSTLKAVDAWAPETLRPFGYIGAALGIQDAMK